MSICMSNRIILCGQIHTHSFPSRQLHLCLILRSSSTAIVMCWIEFEIAFERKENEWNCNTLANKKNHLIFLCYYYFFFRLLFPIFYLDSIHSHCHLSTTSALLQSFLNAPFDIKCSKPCAIPLMMPWPWCTIWRKAHKSYQLEFLAWHLITHAHSHRVRCINKWKSNYLLSTKTSLAESGQKQRCTLLK